MHLTYLSTDSLGEGVGFSQVFTYVTRMAARGVEVSLHSFEKEDPSDAMKRTVADAGVDWHIHPFGRFGAAPGLFRVIRGAMYVRGASLVHARSDMAAAAAMLSRRQHWIWDSRSLYVDQKIELNELKTGSLAESVLRKIEAAAATRSSAIVTLTHAVLPVLDARHGPEVAAKAVVIPTCTDLEMFRSASMPPRPPLRLTLAGTINHYYDLPLMLELVRTARLGRETYLQVVTPDTTRHELRETADSFLSVDPHQMPGILAESHAGLCVCREDAGISLTASMPTKIGEFLAVGRPLVVNPGLGDAADLLVKERCGVVLTTGAMDDCLYELESILDDPETAERCRRLAERHFDVDAAVTRLIDMYKRVLTRR